MKRCCHCKRELPFDQFYRHSKIPDGLQRQCKDCSRESNRAWYARNREKAQAKNQEWMDANLARYKAVRKAQRKKYWRQRRDYNLRWKYGIDLSEFEWLIEQQGGGCGICGKAPKPQFHVDHDHKTNEIRGILCGNCNTGIGMLGDNIAGLERAIAYLSLPSRLGVRTPLSANKKAGAVADVPDKALDVEIAA